MAELFNSVAQAKDFLKRRRLMTGIYHLDGPPDGHQGYILLTGPTGDPHEREAVRFLVNHNWYSTYDKATTYRP